MPRLPSLLVATLALTVAAALPPPRPATARGAKQPPKPAADLYGDPLPAGALARMGTVRGRDSEAGCLAFSPDGKLIATSPINGDYIRLWDAATLREVRRIEGRAQNLAFASEGRTLFA